MDYCKLLRESLLSIHFAKHINFNVDYSIYSAFVFNDGENNADILIMIKSKYYKQFKSNRQQFIAELFNYNASRLCEIRFYSKVINCELKINAKIEFCHKKVKILQPIICTTIELPKINANNIAMITANKYSFYNLLRADFTGKTFANVEHLKINNITDLVDNYNEYVELLLQSFPNIVSFRNNSRVNTYFGCLITKYYLTTDYVTFIKKENIIVVNTQHELFAYLDLSELEQITKNVLVNKCKKVNEENNADFITEHHLIYINATIADIKWRKLLKNAYK